MIEQIELTVFNQVIKGRLDLFLGGTVRVHTDVLTHVQTNQTLGGSFGCLFQHQHANLKATHVNVVGNLSDEG